MSTVSVNLPADIEAQVQRRAKESGYGSLDDYIVDLLRADSGTMADAATEVLIRKRLESPDAGPFTDADFDRIRAKVRAKSR